MEAILKPEHQEELRKFLHFFELKRAESSKELDTAMKDRAKDEMRNEVMFSREEVETVLIALRSEAKSCLDKELQLITHMSAVYAKTLIHQLDNAGLSFVVDTSYLENQRLIEEMARLEKLQRSVDMPRTGSSARLPTLQASYVNDPVLINQLQQANEELLSLRSRCNKYQEQLANTLQDKSSLSSQYISTQSNTQELTKTLHDNQRVIGEQTARIDDQNSLIERLKNEVDVMRRELDVRLRDSKQVKTLKEMLDAKNSELKVCREELGKLSSRS